MRLSGRLIRLSEIIISAVLIILIACSCMKSGTSASEGISENVIALSASNAGLWLLAGGQLAGTSDDAMSLEGIGNDTVSLGDMDHVSLEAIVSLEPGLLILFSTDPAQKALGETAQELGINVYYTNIDCFEDYSCVMKYFTELTGRDDLYEKNVLAVKEEADEVRCKAAKEGITGTYLLLHVSATKNKAEKNDYFACEIFNDLGLVNIADGGSSFDELSLEAIISADPDYIFVVPRGNEEKALKGFDELFAASPGWSALSAVKNNSCYILPKELFGLKPNDRWGEAYRQAFDIVSG